MSLLTFPLTFSQSIGFPIKTTPRYNTLIQTPASGRGVIRIPTMLFPLWDFTLDVSFLSGDAQGTYDGSVVAGGTQWQKLINFYMAVQGSASDWLFFHPYDNSVGTYTVAGSLTSGRFIVGEPIVQSITSAQANFVSYIGSTFTVTGYSGTPNNSNTWVGQTSGAIYTPSATPVLVSSMAFATGDGSTTAFSITRTLISNGALDLIQNFVTPPLIYDNGSLVSSSNYSIDEYGTITFVTAPLSGHIISWTGLFQFRCYFLKDEWSDLEENFYQIWTLSGLSFRSVLL
jgi:Conserved hypothetical protein 2217 (DUF2460)